MGVDASAVFGVGIYVDEGKEEIINKLLELDSIDWDCGSPPDSSHDDYESELEDWIDGVSWECLAEAIGSPTFRTISAGTTYGYNDAEGMYLFLNVETLTDMYQKMPIFIEEVGKLGIVIEEKDIQLRGEAFFS